MRLVLRSAFVAAGLALGACGGQETPSSLTNSSGDSDGGTANGDASARDGGGTGDSDGGIGNGNQCTVASDCGPNPGAACAQTCADGSNPCAYACSTLNACVLRGCPDDGAPSGCTPECSTGNICVKKQFNGGAELMVDDAGACPPGRHPQGQFCQADPTFACVARPAGCGVPFDCSCAASVCTGSYECTGTTPREIDCALNAP